MKRDVPKLARDDHEARAATFAAGNILTEYRKNSNPDVIDFKGYPSKRVCTHRIALLTGSGWLELPVRR